MSRSGHEPKRAIEFNVAAVRALIGRNVFCQFTRQLNFLKQLAPIKMVSYTPGATAHSKIYYHERMKPNHGIYA